MKTFSKTAGLFVAASAFALTATPASAQRVDRIVAFGDSYADTGIAKNVLLNDPDVSAGTKAQISAAYPTGRFSGGTNYIDTLSQILGAPVVNYAVGGALATGFTVPFNTAGSFNTSCGPSGTTPATGNDICPLGFNFQIDQALNAAPDATYFPAGVGAFGPNDLVTVSIGGNDARYYQQHYSTAPDPGPTGAFGPPQPIQPFINASIAGATAGLDRIVAAGAPTISFLAGDTGRLPEVLANPAAAAIRTTYSSAFNSGMQSVLAGYAADGVMVHYLDLNIVLDNILANPSAYGITRGSAATGYTCPTPTPAAPGCLVDQSGYLFYVDGLHLTSQGFRIVAAYVDAQLTAPLMIGGAGTMTLDNARQFGRSMTQRMDSTAPRDGDMPEGMRFNIEADGYHVRNEMTASTDAFRSSGIGLMGTLEYGFGSGVAGVAVRAAKPKAHFYGENGGSDAKALELGVYGGFGVAGGFVQGYAGLGRDRLDIDRKGVVNDIEADPKGHHALAGLKGGYLIPTMGMRVGPVASLDWAHSYVKSYTEEGDAALNLGVGSTKVKSLRGSLGVEARGDIDLNGTAFRPYAGAAVEKQFADNDRTIYFRQQSAPIIVNHWNVVGESKDIYGRLIGGIAANVIGSVRVDASIQGTVGRDGGNETAGNLAARIAF